LDSGAVRAERHSDADPPAPLADRVCQDSINAYSGEHHSDDREYSDQSGLEPALGD
jgi:hypothetical protein